MDVILIMSSYYILYGIAGILGFQVISDKYKGHVWTKRYIRSLGISWILLGIPWLAFDRVMAYYDIGTALCCVILFVLAIPSLVFTFYIDRKYKSLLKK